MGAATHDQFSQRQPTEARRRWSGCTWSRRWSWCVVATAILVLAALGFILYHTTGEVPDDLSIAIDSVSGLDPAKDLGRRPAVVDPEFNITLRLASHKLWSRECIESGMYVEVSYRGLSLAASVTTPEKICVGGAMMKEVDRSVVARGAGVVVPGSVLDSLAGDMRLGVQVFDVTLRGWGNYVMSSCGPRRVDSVPSPC